MGGGDYLLSALARLLPYNIKKETFENDRKRRTGSESLLACVNKAF